MTTPTDPAPANHLAEPSLKSNAERKGILAHRVVAEVSSGKRIESQTDVMAVLVKGRRVNHLLHFFVGIFTLGLWWWVWAFLAITGGERRQVITVDDYGNLNSHEPDRRVLRWIVIAFGGLIVLFIALIIIAAALGGTSTSTGGGQSSTPIEVPRETMPSGPHIAAIGTAQKVGDAEVTVHGVRRSTGGALGPDAGNVYVIVDVAMRNTGDNAYELSSFLQTGLRDGEGRNYDQAIFADAQANFNGTVAVGGLLRGEVGFEIPAASTGLVFIFEQVFGSGQAFWSVD